MDPPTITTICLIIFWKYMLLLIGHSCYLIWVLTCHWGNMKLRLTIQSAERNNHRNKIGNMTLCHLYDIRLILYRLVCTYYWFNYICSRKQNMSTKLIVTILVSSLWNRILHYPPQWVKDTFKSFLFPICFIEKKSGMYTFLSKIKV